MKWLASLLAVCCFMQPVAAQDIEVTGLVLGTTGEGVPYANITVEKRSTEVEVIAYAVSDVDGKFKLKFPSGKEILSINVSAIGYAEKTIQYDISADEEIEIMLASSTTDLSRIVVKAKKAIGDTLNISINEMNLSQNDDLEKILERTAGVILGEDGTISYRGKQITKVMINGKEVFINQNKTALKNLTYEIMESVQVIDNHKSKFELNFDRIRDPVINIDTKDEFKGVIKAELAGGYGYRNRYTGSAKGFYFSDKFNTFTTGQINNFGEKVFSQSDLTKAYESKMTPAAKNQLFPFSARQEQAKKNIFNGNDIVARTEGERSKTGLQIGGGWLNLVVNQNKNIFLSDTLINSSESSEKQLGEYLTGALNHTVKLTPNLIFSNKTNMLRTTLTRSIFSQDSIFVPNRTSVTQLTDETLTSLAVQNSTRLSKIISGDWLLRAKVGFYHEEINESLSSKLTNTLSNAIDQTIALNKNEVSLASEVQHKRKNASLTMGLSVALRREKAVSNFPLEAFFNDDFFRNINEYGLRGTYEGTVNKLTYSFSVAPIIIGISNSPSKYFVKTSNRLEYHIQPQNVLDLSFTREFNFQRIDKLLSITASSVNSIVESEVPRASNIVTNNVLSLGWSNRNLARSRFLSLNYYYIHQNDDIQTVLDRIDGSRFIYVNRQIPYSVFHLLNLYAKKGVFIGDRLNKLNFSTGFEVSANRYPTLIDRNEAEAAIVSLTPKFEIQYEPRKKYIREVSNKLEYGYQKINIGGITAGFQTSIVNTFNVRGGRKKTSFEFNFTVEKYLLDQGDFSIPDVNFISSYDITEDLSLSLNASRLLTLLNVNNFNSVQTFSDGNIVVQSFNNNNLSYLILNVTCKL